MVYGHSAPPPHPRLTEVAAGRWEQEAGGRAAPAGRNLGCGLQAFQAVVFLESVERF